MYNQDIKLKPIKNGQYDREYYINDFQTTKKLESIENSIIISLMTRLGELNHNPTYTGFGCSAWNHIKANHTPLTKTNIQETIKTCLKKIKSIKNVEHVQIEPHPTKTHILNIFFTITLNDDAKINDKFEIGGI